MAQTVGQHGVAAFTNPSNGDPLNATVVKANDNTVRGAYVDHDNDGGIHVQSSLLASRPSAGTAGRKWLTTDTGSVKLWFDTGSAWEEISYLTASSNLNASNLASGTIPDARFPAVLPAVSGANLTNLPTASAAAGTLTGTTLASDDHRDADGLDGGRDGQLSGQHGPAPEIARLRGNPHRPDD